MNIATNNPNPSQPPLPTTTVLTSRTVCALDPYLDLQRWVDWRNEPRNGKLTKVPYGPNTKREAKADDPGTWGTFYQAMLNARDIRSALGLGSGFGLQLGDLGDGYALGGLDLDSCRSEDGRLEPWAAEAIERFGSYTEISPSGTGAKTFFLYRVADLPRLREAMGGAQWGKMFKRKSGGDHPPAIELYLGHRYFATTWRHLIETPDEIRIVDAETILSILQEAGLRFKRAAKVAATTVATSGATTATVGLAGTKPALAQVRSSDLNAAAQAGDANDDSRSGRAYRLGCKMYREGKTFEEFCDSARTNPDTGVASWYSEKGTANNSRELRRIWKKAGEANTTASSGNYISFRPFRMDNNGLFCETKDEDDNKSAIKISAPFEVVSQTRDKNNKSWGLELRWHDPDGQLHEWIMAKSLLAGPRDELLREFMSNGLWISAGQAARNRFIAYLSEVQVKERARVVYQTGWSDFGDVPLFVLPERELRQDGETVMLDPVVRVTAPYNVAGTLDEWRYNVSVPCVGNSRLVFGVSTAFTGPMLHFAGAENPGFNIYGDSRSGKTTVADASGSVWGGGPKHGFKKTWRGTANGIEAVCAGRNDTLLILDEMGQGTPNEVAQIVYMVGNGQGKMRADRTGAARGSAEWRIITLSTGEVTFAEKVGEIGKKAKAGQLVRLADVKADAGKGLGIFEDLHGEASPERFAERLSQAALSIYGTAGRQFVELLSAKHKTDPSSIGAFIQQVRTTFLATHLPKGAAAQVRSVCTRFALVAAGGRLATEFGLTGWPGDEAERAAAACFNSWLSERGSIGDHEIEAAIRQVIAFVEAHGASRFDNPWPMSSTAIPGNPATIVAGAPPPPPLPPRDGRTMNRAGFRQYNEKHGLWVYMVLPAQWRDELCRGFDANAVAREMAQRKLIIPDPTGKTSRSERVPGEGRVRLYVLSPLILDGR
jgi:uncharacterized protein (DUF927 family)